LLLQHTHTARPCFAYWSSQECTIRIDKAREQLGCAPVKSIVDGLAEMRSA
jgi:hypothetical protein